MVTGSLAKPKAAPSLNSNCVLANSLAVALAAGSPSSSPQPMKRNDAVKASPPTSTEKSCRLLGCCIGSYLHLLEMKVSLCVDPFSRGVCQQMKMVPNVHGI